MSTAPIATTEHFGIGTHAPPQSSDALRIVIVTLALAALIAGAAALSLWGRGGDLGGPVAAEDVSLLAD